MYTFKLVWTFSFLGVFIDSYRLSPGRGRFNRELLFAASWLAIVVEVSWMSWMDALDFLAWTFFIGLVSFNFFFSAVSTWKAVFKTHFLVTLSAVKSVDIVLETASSFSQTFLELLMPLTTSFNTELFSRSDLWNTWTDFGLKAWDV